MEHYLKSSCQGKDIKMAQIRTGVGENIIGHLRGKLEMINKQLKNFNSNTSF